MQTGGPFSEVIARSLRRALAILSTGWGRPELPAHQIVGRVGEKAAARFLRSRGYKVLARNFQTRAGEADLVVERPAGDGGTGWAVVEVKTRTITPGKEPFGAVAAPEAAIDRDKQRRLAGIARHLARANHWPAGQVRIDIVAVDVEGGRPIEVRHYPGAVIFSG